MADTIREQIIAAFALRLTAEREPLNELLEVVAAFPVTALAAGADSVQLVQYGANQVTMTVTVERVDVLPDGVNPSVRANSLLGALIQETTGTDRTLGGLCEDIQYAAGEEIARESGSNLVGARTTFTVRYNFLIGDPFTIS